MTTAAKKNFGNTFWMAAHLSPVVKIAELLSIDPPVMSRDMIDATSHDSAGGAEEVIAEGTYDPGEIKGQMHYIAGSTGDDAMIAALAGGTLMDFKIVVKAAAGTEDMTGSGYVTSYGPDGMATKGKQTAAFSLKVSGGITQAASA